MITQPRGVVELTVGYENLNFYNAMKHLSSPTTMIIAKFFSLTLQTFSVFFFARDCHSWGTDWSCWL